MADQEFTPEELQTEEWRDVINYEGLYAVSSLGRIKRLTTVSVGFSRHAGDILKPSPTSKGYLGITLRGTDGSAKLMRVHRLVGAAFIGECPIGHEVNHVDGMKSNNRHVNLEYVTHQENVAHAIRVGIFSHRQRSVIG